MIDTILRIIRTPAARIVMAITLLVSIPLYVLSYTLIPKTGNWDFTITAWTGPVANVTPRGNAWKAGIRNGDVVSIPRNERVQYEFPVAGERLQLMVRRGNAARMVSVVATPQRIHFDAAQGIRTAVVFCLLLFSLLIIVRAWDTEFGPLIAAWLTWGMLQAGVDQMPQFATAGFLGALLDINQLALGFSLGLYDFFLVLLCAAVAGRTSRTLRFLLWAAFVNVLIATVTDVLFVPGYMVTLSDAAYNALNACLYSSVFLPVPALLAALAAARDEHRSRMLWLFWGLFPDALGLSLVASGDLWFVPPTVFNDPIVHTIARGLEISLPIALFYGLLVRRTVDIGFVVNRVAVFGVISAVVLGIFVLLEYLAGQFLETHGAASWAIQLGIAMVIGVSARYLHGAVDRFVDRVFFAKRHADETALKRFAQEAEAFTSVDALLDRAVEAVDSHSETVGAAIYLCGDREAVLARGSGPFPHAVDIDDPLLVALRRWNEPVDTHDAKTAFPDGMVFPMSARGKLIGALACRTKRDTTAFAPDEREPLVDVSRSIARAIDTLQTQGGSSGAFGAILLSLQDIRQSIASLTRVLQADSEISA